MSLSDIVRSAIRIAHGVTKSVQVDVTIQAWTGQSGEGDDTYAGAVTYPALVERRSRVRYTIAGEQYMARALVTFLEPIKPHGTSGRQEPIDSRDIVTLPDGFTAPIEEIAGLVSSDTTKPYAFEVWLGDALRRTV